MGENNKKNRKIRMAKEKNEDAFSCAYTAAHNECMKKNSSVLGDRKTR